MPGDVLGSDLARLCYAKVMTPNTTDTNLFLDINRFAQRTGWLHGAMSAVASYGIAIFAALLLLGWIYARRQDLSKMAALVWAALGTLVAVAVNQPVVKHFHETRPFMNLHHILVITHHSADYGFPSDHATAAGAAAAGLFLVNPLLGVVGVIFALILSFSRVYIAAHYPYDVVAGLVLGAAVVSLGYLLVHRPLTFILTKLSATPLRPLITSGTREPSEPAAREV